MRLTEDRRTILIWEIGISILLVLCLTLLLLTGFMINTVIAETASGNLKNQEDINQTSNNSQSSSTGPVEEPVIEEDTETTVTVYPQKWATGDGTVENPWANDCIQKAYDACPAGETIYLKAGYYQLADALMITKPINIIGEGIDKTIVVTAEAHGFYLEEVDYVTIKGMTIDGAAQEDGNIDRYNICIRQACNYLLFQDLEIKNSGRIGIASDQHNYAVYQNIYAHDNWSHGIHPGTNTSGGWNMYNVYRDIYCWNNGRAGFDDIGNNTDKGEYQYNTYDNIHAWDNTGTGIYIANQGGSSISNCSASDNGSVGFSLSFLKDCSVDNCEASGNTIGMYMLNNSNIDINNFSGFLNSEDGIKIVTSDNINVDNCLVTLNDKSGIYFDGVENINVINVIAKNNNGASSTYGGFVINDSDDITLTSCQSYDDRDTLVQRYGLVLTGTTTGVSLLNCKLSPNKNGEIYNPAGVAVTVITEKREFLLLSL